jgi:nucleoside-diphosphate-sugar epimerase
VETLITSNILLSTQLAEAMVAMGARRMVNTGLSCISLKLYDTYGPDDQRRKLINLLLDAARTGEPLAMSPGEQEVELTHLDDVTAAFARAADLLLESAAPRLETYLVPGTRLTVQDLVARVAQATGRPIEVQWGGRPYRPREVMVPVAPAGRCLPNWAPQVELGAGLAACLHSRKNRGD